MTRNTQPSLNERARSSLSTFDAINASCRFVRSIDELDRASWERCYAGCIEGYDYHRAIERAGIDGFSFGWFAVEQGRSVVAAVPVFFTEYDLATTAQGTVAAVLRALRRWVPGGLRLRLSCLGSPETETCDFGFDQDLSAEQCNSLLEVMLNAWSEHAAKRGISLLGLKDISQVDYDRYGGVLRRHRYTPVASLPMAYLAIDFASTEEYLSRLSHATRKDMRRKLRRRSEVRVEFADRLDDVLVELMEMYSETRARSDWQFETLSGDYFKNLKAGLGDAALVALYYSGRQLIGANLLLVDGHTLLDKFFVMRSDPGRDLNLYFISWFTNIDVCLRRGLRLYLSGQAAYEAKLRLGCKLQRNWLFFRHSNTVVNWLLRLAAPLLAVEPPLERPALDRSSAK